MRNNNCKNQPAKLCLAGQQFPGQVEAVNEKIRVIPVLQPNIESPVCLIKSHTGPCNHKWCSMVHQKPHFYGRTVSEFYNTHDFSEFNVIRSPVGHPHIIPKNPNPGAEDGFELFRQSMTAVTHMAGSWPDIDVAPREHVEFRWVEHIDCYPETDRITGSVIWKDRLDVKLCAFYVGPINIIGIKPIDVNAVFAVPEIFLTP